ncbi:hypothetical protein FBU30_003119 [Linnemannia zychae]|nr:hypothetical protein FBU30_003119 [Linnemannia zychae]
MCFKNMTKLRIISGILTFIGLSISVVGYLRANNSVLPNVYWAWNFLAEAVAVIPMAVAIVTVGAGFYPMSSGRNIYARLSFVVILLYAVVSLCTFGYYVHTRVIKHFIPPEEVQQLRYDIVKSELFTQDHLISIIRRSEARGLIPKDTNVTGAADYTQLSLPEQTFFMRPSLGFYLAHQMLMIATCLWVSMYLFIPLVKNHRHGPAGRSVDSDMMAVGVWYLTCLFSLATGYGILNIIYCFDNELLYKPQIQALDLCLRITIGPIFFLPAPKTLIRFYRDHFKKFRSSSANKTSSNERWGSRWRKGGSGSNANGCNSISNSTNIDSGARYDSTHIDSRNQHTMSRLGRGSGGGVDDAIECANLDASGRNNYQYESGLKSKVNMPITMSPPPPAHKQLKLSRSRDRGLSVESSRVLTRDFECDSSYPSDHDIINNVGNRPDSYYHQDYYSANGGMLVLDSLSPGRSQLHPNPHMGHRHNGSNSSDSSNGSTAREKRMTHGYEHPKPPKLTLSPQQQQFLQSAPRSNMRRADSAESPSRVEFPRSPIS